MSTNWVGAARDQSRLVLLSTRMRRSMIPACSARITMPSAVFRGCKAALSSGRSSEDHSENHSDCVTVAGRAWRQSSTKSSPPGVMLSIQSIPQVPEGASRTATVRLVTAKSTSHLSESLSSPGPSFRTKFGSWNRYSPSGPVTTANLSRSLSSNAARSARSAPELTRTGAVVGSLFSNPAMCSFVFQCNIDTMSQRHTSGQGGLSGRAL